MSVEFENDLLVLVYDLARLMRIRADRFAAKYGMTRAQWVILKRLKRQPGLSQNELAAAAEVAPISIGRLIDRLEEQGLVERHSDPDDRRVWRLRLTPKAEPHLKHIDEYRAQLQALMTEGIKEEAIPGLIQALLQMKRNLSADVRPVQIEKKPENA